MRHRQKIILNQPTKYLINGGLATVVHFLILTLIFKVLMWSSAGIANMVAAIFGISFSFFGNRYFVFKNSNESFLNQFYSFIFLYIAISLLHGALMYALVDLYSMNYVVGFGVATIMQVLLSYFGNKSLVFKV